MDQDIVAQIRETLKAASEDNCACCQGTTLRWLSDLGWQWIEVEGKNAKVRFGFKITDTRLEIFSKPGILSNCLGGSNELQAP